MSNGAVQVPQPVRQPTPDWDRVRQTDDYPMHEVPVRVRGSMGVWNLPAKRSSMQLVTVTSSSNNENELIPADPRLKRVWISAPTSGVTIGTKEQIAASNGPYGFQLPANQPMPWEGFEEPLYGVASSPIVISLRFEYWSD